MSYAFSLLSFDNVPTNPPYKAWFAAWSTDRSKLDWTSTRPTTPPESDAAWVIYVSGGDAALAPGAKVLAKGVKDVPPPPLLAADIASKGLEVAFQDTFNASTAKSWSPS
jgi:hypothetical protein